MRPGKEGIPRCHEGRKAHAARHQHGAHAGQQHHGRFGQQLAQRSGLQPRQHRPAGLRAQPPQQRAAQHHGHEALQLGTSIAPRLLRPGNARTPDRGPHQQQQHDAHDAVGTRPAQPGIGQDEAAAARDQHGQPVAQHRDSGTGAPFLGREQVGPIGIEDHVLRGRQPSHHHRQHGDQMDMVGRIKLGQPQAGQRHGQLKDQDPAPPPAQQPGLEAIKQRRPDKLEGIGQPHQREVADGVQVNAIDREPRLQCPRRERQRQPAGKAQQQHRGNAPRREDLPIGLPQPGRGLGGIAHPPSVAAHGRGFMAAIQPPPMLLTAGQRHGMNEGGMREICDTAPRPRRQPRSAHALPLRVPGTDTWPPHEAPSALCPTKP